MWQMANQGPKTGECGHFRRLKDSQGDQTYAVRRFTDEVNRLYGVMNNRLYDAATSPATPTRSPTLISYPWTVGWEGQGQDINDFPYFKRWFDEIGARPAVQRGMAVGKDMTVDFSKLSKEEIAGLTKLLYNQRARPAPAGGLL